MPDSSTSRETGIILQGSDDAQINKAIARGLHFGIRLKQVSAIRVLIHSVKPDAVSRVAIQRVVDRHESGRHTGIILYGRDDAQLNQLLRHALAHNLRLTQQLALRVLLQASHPDDLSEEKIREILSAYPSPAAAPRGKLGGKKRPVP